MGVTQRAGPGTNPRIPHVVSKSDNGHGTTTTAHRTPGLIPAGTICRSNLSLSNYPIRNFADNALVHIIYAMAYCMLVDCLL